MTHNFETVVEKRRRVVRRELFLQIMEDVLPWDEWVDYIFTQCPNDWLGHTTGGMEKMLRLYLLQSWYNLNEETVLDCVHDSRAMLSFVGGPTADLPEPHELFSFRRLLERERIDEKLTESINRALRKGGAVLRGGSIVDAAVIRLPHGTPETAGQNGRRTE